MNLDDHKNEFDSKWDLIMSFQPNIYPLKSIAEKLNKKFNYDFKIVSRKNTELLYVGSGLSDETWGYLRGYLQHIIETYDDLLE